MTGPSNFLNGLTANTISATTIQTGSFRANNGGITATTISATTYQNLPSGSFGVSNSNGIYTYYNSFNNAISAATSGQTVEMFGDITETGNVSITLKGKSTPFLTPLLINVN